MPLAKSKTSVGLGNSLMNDRFGKGKGSDRKKGAAVTRINHSTGEEYITNDRKEAAWVKMRSVTEQGALDEFLATAELAGTDFTAEKMNNVKIIHTDQRNPYLLSATEERGVLGKHAKHRGKLTVPRRPKWDSSTTADELDQLERESFLNWRRGLAELQEHNDLLMTPFERNLEVWRQLWRVIERSDLVVQIVDARNPLMFRSEDLESYVKDVNPAKKNLLLVNKADMMTTNQRKAWATYFKEKRIAYRFFSASLAKQLIDERDLEDEQEEPLVGQSSNPKTIQRSKADSAPEDESDEDEDEDEEDSGVALTRDSDDDTRILTVEELEDIFLKHAYDPDDPDKKLQIGLVGYPNVGKSSTINALIGAKKVSVSATPGKTKHFQTIHLSDKVILCDCPGLVFPNFATTKADLVCNGVLPIDQLREFTGPAALVAHRIPQPFLEAIYGIHIKTRPLEEGGTGFPTASELLAAYARARGFATQGVGQPDESRAARVILKDYVNGKLLYVEPPPNGGDGADFNRELYDAEHLPEKRKAALLAAMDALDVGDGESTVDTEMLALPTGVKSAKLDKAFFARQGNSGHMRMPFSHKYTEQGKAQAQAQAQAKHLSGRKARAMIALETGVDPKDVQLGSSKKHFKGGIKGKGKRVDNKMLNED
ncbi:P-loop containing nucleoside triphosphate hydrolase protein [Annulohypoxylon maeteangense]|uniref:P-loop containing nucleoside triphosphate hydrolase protein n=1 Tax=Annulohypoxylon maeteangense TaxID=1927788 RepID=UPI00200737A2|nr:P-loop containing nucleoside triphosphate hydrolase protein [Annulohypoxylon maeteangense]KAI0884366.1 P-loop containing nucleoside triphosphate hydrolase protein [Annulohypoxylon maeteangense]